MKITELAYLGFESPDYLRWKDAGPNVFGFGLGESGPDGAVRLRLDERHHRLSMHPGARDRVAYVGWAVQNKADFERAIADLRAAGVEATKAPELAAVRAMTNVARYRDPSGVTHELSCGPVGSSPFAPGLGMSPFVTGDGGLGHVVLLQPDLDAATRFFTNVMGLRPSDVCHDFTEARFFHCNPRHHSLAIAAAPVPLRGVQHIMVEASSMDDVGATLDRVVKAGFPITLTLGRHTNDHMLSFYCRVPGGFDIEFGCGGLRIEDEASWKVKTIQGFSSWGHKLQPVPPASGLEPAAA